MTKKKELAKVGDPLVIEHGDLLMEEGLSGSGEVPPAADLEPSTPVPFSEYRPQERRVTKDLRATKGMLNGACAVFSYTLLGISDAEISANTGLSTEEIAKIRGDRTYSEVFEAIMHALINANSEYIEARLSAHSGMAVQTVSSIARESANIPARLSAAKDLLDRSGHRPQDRGYASSGANEFRIVITKADNTETKITFNNEEV